jgi:hypothetical protein
MTMRTFRKLRAASLFVSRRHPSSFPANSRCDAVHSGRRKCALGLRSEQRLRACAVAQLALDGRKDIAIPVGSMPLQPCSE